jgi:8-oxo-dGTP pyrophosphatase MutT (NUDIX family)
MTKSKWSHAGGVVVRSMEGELQYLLVEASDSRDVWVLPKGHIEKGETPEQAAVREVIEEAGVRAIIVARAGESEFDVKGKTVRTVFFLMQYQGEAGRTETRGLAWRPYKDALALLHFENSRRILMQAHAVNN